MARDWLQVGRLPHYEWKSHWTITIRGKTRCVLLHFDSSKRCVCPLYKFLYAFKFVKFFLKHPVYLPPTVVLPRTVYRITKKDRITVSVVGKNKPQKLGWGMIYLLVKKVKVQWCRYRPGVAQRVGRGITLLFHDRDTRWGWAVNSTPRMHFTPGEDPVPILLEAGWAPGLVLTDGKSRLHQDSIPDSPASSQSLNRLSYPAHIYLLVER